ncbi:MAG: PBP1A family penicillin-binding protein [bacterium]
MHPMFRKWLLIFLGFLLLGVTAAGAALGALLGYMEQLPSLDVLENYNPPEITRVYDRTGNNQIAEFFSERREVVNIDDVPEHVVNAFIAIEDERFLTHFGVDMQGIVRALLANLRSGEKVQGASTITMQVARNIVLQDTRKKFSRKIREILVSLQIERNYSKKQILEFYMNQIYFGAQAYGVQAAARTYFNKSVKDLTIPEAALIAGLPKAPSQLSPFRDAEKARDRRNAVLRNMRKEGYIKSDEELERYLAMPIELNPASHAKTEVPYFVDYARSLLMKDNSMQNSSDLGNKGYTIISTVDLNLQKICEEELSKGLQKVEKEIENQKSDRFSIEARELSGARKKQVRLARIKEVRDKSVIVTLQGCTGEIPLPEKLPFHDPQYTLKPGNLIDIHISGVKNGKLTASFCSYVQGAAVLLDVKSGEILALAGGDNFYDAANNGQWNRAVQGGRQPGSCWKPLLYSSAFDVDTAEGKPRFTPSYVEMDEPLTFPDGWSPKNYEGRHYGATTLNEALVKSRNIPTIKLFMDIGPKKATQLYQKFKVVDKDVEWKLDPVPSMPLGTPNVTPLELAAAYAAIGNLGIGITPTPMKRIYSPKTPGDSRIIKPEQTKVLTPQAAYMAARIMQDVVTMGTAKTTVGKWVDEQNSKGRKLPEIAGKTGTTNNCFVAWFVGYTPDLALAIYVGFDEHRSMGPKMVGGRTVGPIWAPMMDRILATRNAWKMKFDVPQGIVFRDICSVTGKLATEGCGSSGADVFRNAAFKAGSEPKSSCEYHAGGGQQEGQPADAESGYSTPGYGEQGQQQPQEGGWYQ